jgi:hypothetical protein
VQLDPTATLLPHVFAVMLKSPAFVPIVATKVIVNTAIPLFISVTVWVALVVPMVWLKNVRLIGEKTTGGVFAYSMAIIWLPWRMYSFAGLLGLRLWATVSEAVVSSSKRTGSETKGGSSWPLDVQDKNEKHHPH